MLANCLQKPIFELNLLFLMFDNFIDHIQIVFEVFEISHRPHVNPNSCTQCNYSFFQQTKSRHRHVTGIIRHELNKWGRFYLPQITKLTYNIAMDCTAATNKKPVGFFQSNGNLSKWNGKTSDWKIFALVLNDFDSIFLSFHQNGSPNWNASFPECVKKYMR